MINSCVVGFGAIGPVHAKAIKDIENAKVYAICDINTELADKGAAEYGAKAYYSLDEALKDENIQVFHVCTPHYLHYSMIKKIKGAGKKAIVEKPVTMLKEEFEAVKDTDICPVFQNRENKCIKTLKTIVENDKSIGKLIGAKGIVMWHRDEEYYKSNSWRGKKATEGGGVLINQAIHTLDLLSYLCGDIVKVTATNSNKSLKGVIDTEDTANALLKFKSGASGMLFATVAYPCNSSNIIELQFENAVFRYIGSTLFKNNEVIETDSSTINGKKYWGSGHKSHIEKYYNAILGGTDDFLKISDIKNTMYSLFAIYESAEKNGEEVTVCK